MIAQENGHYTSTTDSAWGSSTAVVDMPPVRREQYDVAGLSMGDVHRRVEVAPSSTKRQRSKQKSDVKPASNKTYRSLCDNLARLVGRLPEYLVDGILADEGLEVVIQIEDLLEELYDCGWGEGESLKRTVVAVKSQTGNAQWNSPLVAFLAELAPWLRQRYQIDESVVAECFRMMKSHGLDPFRGTVSSPETRRKYVVQEIVEP